MDLTVKKRLAIAGTVLLVLAGTFAAGRYTAPERVVEKSVEVVRVEEKLVEKVVARELTREEMDRLRDEIRNESRRREIVEVVQPDGTRTRTEVETVDTRSEVREAETRVVEKIVEKVVEVEKLVAVEKIVEKEKIVESPRRNWLISASALVDVTQVQALPGAELQFPVELGGQVQRRIVGPLWVGVQGTHRGSVGLTLGLEF